MGAIVHFRELHDKRRRNVVRKVAGHAPRIVFRPRRIIEPERVGIDRADVAQILARAQNFDQFRIDLERGEGGAAGDERSGKRAGSGADFDDARTRRCACHAELRDAQRGAGIEKKVLTVAFAGTQAPSCEQRARVRRLRHFNR